MALRTRSDYFGARRDHGAYARSWRARRASSRRLTGYPVQYNKAIIGRNAFAHEAGIHQHGVLEDRETYEIIDASTVGQEAAQIVLGKHSGRHAFADSLDKMGLHVQGDALNQAFTRFKELADRKVRDHRGRPRGDRRRGARHRRRAPVLDREPRAARRHAGDAERGGRARRRRAARSRPTATGNGMIDAAVDAISQGHRRRRARCSTSRCRRSRRWRRARRRRDPARVRRRQGVGPRRRHRRGRGVGARLPQRGQQDRAAPRASRPARRRRGRPVTMKRVDAR